MAKISYSQYSTWAKCPKSWKLKYVDGHDLDEQTIHTIFGTAMHEVIQDWLTNIVFKKSESVAKHIDLSENLKNKLFELFKENTKILPDDSKVFPCDKLELMEFYEQGCEILEYIQKNQKTIFPNNNVELVGIEHELSLQLQPGINYVGFIDIVTKHKLTGKITIYDLKTSRAGWTQKDKSNPLKLQQILLYKKFYSQQMDVPLDMIQVEFIILKRTIFENSMFKIPRVTKFAPSHGNPSVRKAWEAFQMFINECFEEGEHKKVEMEAKPSKDNCRYCPFKTRKDLCSVGVS
jgi:hypothetical protein